LDTFPKEIKDKIEIFAGDIQAPNGVRSAMEDCDTPLCQDDTGHFSTLI